MRGIEKELVNLQHSSTMREHVEILEASMIRFKIRDPSRIFTINETGFSFKSIYFRRIWSRIGTRTKNLYNTIPRTRGILYRLSLMGVVSASSQAFNPTVVLPGKKPHYRRHPNVTIATVHSYLPPFYQFHLDPAGVDSAFFDKWGKEFISETDHLRLIFHKLLLVYDGYSFHIQAVLLIRLKDSGVITIPHPSYLFHARKSLLSSVFGALKIFIQGHFHQMSREKKFLSLIEVSSCIRDVHDRYFTSSTIISGFKKAVFGIRISGNRMWWHFHHSDFREHYNRSNISVFFRGAFDFK